MPTAGPARSAILCPTTLDNTWRAMQWDPSASYAQVVGSSAAVRCNAGADNPVAKLLDDPVAKLHGCYGAVPGSTM